MTSVIIPHFNRSRLIRETIASVEAQTNPNWELIIVDDGSDPGERKALEAFAGEKIRILDRTDGDKGPSRCRNLGAASAKGDYLVFLDSDDLLGPTCLEQRLDAARKEPDYDLWVFPAGQFRDHPGDMEALWGTMLPGGDDAARFARGDAPWHTSSPLWKRDAFAELGGFNERIFYGDDADLHIRAVLQGLRILQYPSEKPHAFVRRSDEERITNTLDDATIQSRLIRLEEGNLLLDRRYENQALRNIWEGQHFVEAEFLLFRHQSRVSIDSVLSLWKNEFRPSIWKRFWVRFYFKLSLLTRDRAYLILRVARRAAMLALPGEYFGK